MTEDSPPRAPVVPCPVSARRELARRGEAGRRRARFTFLAERARKAVAGQPYLTPDEWLELAAIYEAAAKRGAPRGSSP